MSEEKRREYCWSPVIRRRLDRIDARLREVIGKDERCASGGRRGRALGEGASAFLQLEGIELTQEESGDAVLGREDAVGGPTNSPDRPRMMEAIRDMAAELSERAPRNTEGDDAAGDSEDGAAYPGGAESVVSGFRDSLDQDPGEEKRAGAETGGLPGPTEIDRYIRETEQFLEELQQQPRADAGDEPPEE